jgi:hypothetical protein
MRKRETSKASFEQTKKFIARLKNSSSTAGKEMKEAESLSHSCTESEVESLVNAEQSGFQQYEECSGFKL